MDKGKINVLVIGVSLLDGMASSVRVRNLVGPLIKNRSIRVKNLIYSVHRIGKPETLELLESVNCKVIGFSMRNPLSAIKFLIDGCRFIRKSKSPKAKNVMYHYDYPDIKSILFILYARFIGYKIIIDLIEDNDLVTHYVSFMNRIRILSSRVFLKFSPLVTDGYIAISNHLEIKLKAMTNKPVYLIPISVNLDFFGQGGPVCNKRDSVRIFYGGSFARKDGLNFLIAAFDQVCKRFDNVSLILTGRGLDCDMEAIRSQIEQLECKNKIFFKGYLETDEYYSVMNGCDIFCMTRNKSLYANAGFPFKLGEFLAAGKGVVATKVGDVGNYLVSGENSLLIDSESVEQLTEAISFFVSNREQIEVMGYKARLTAEENFDSEKLSRKLIKIFQAA